MGFIVISFWLDKGGISLAFVDSLSPSFFLISIIVY